MLFDCRSLYKYFYCSRLSCFELLYLLFQTCFEDFFFFLVSNVELMFLETSALTGENVEEAFVQCARKILNKIESGKLSFIFIESFI